METKPTSPKAWEATGRSVQNETVCPDCFSDPVRKAKGGGIVKEYTQDKGGIKRYAYRCEQTKNDNTECGTTVEKISDPAQTDLEIGAVMERGYLDNVSKKTDGADFK